MPESVPVLRRPVTWLIAAAAVLVIAVVVVLAILLAPAPSPESAEPAAESRPSPAEAAAPTPVALPEPEPVRDPRVPTDCTAIYTTDWSGTFAPEYVLNPPWSTAEGAPALFGTGDATALPVLQQTSQLACGWLPPDTGDGTVGLVTNLAAVDEAQTAAVIAAFQAAGMECYEESGGTRCIAEWEGAAGSAGESQFLREGLWIATRWDGPAVSGYTADIIAKIFG
ncbi:hypothetical protein ACFPER_01330 [Agromyces aurantiacus]|uniref:Uncharacterized protein n=1 Tax=Agromyces aurantiacus TaxID=165814 RepID=A0ABV9R1N7_9MICO|nr:hypothetical protein [Agromyces aurantiacus]MBM7505728.1 hypothetical protein [Agromyces aurantiacus]